MSQSYFIHKTLRKSCNVLDVIPGKWHPDIPNLQYLFNNHTYFELYHFVQTSDGFKLVKFYQQLFLSKVYSICSGPPIKELSSFFALRDYDIIQFSYDAKMKIFVLNAMSRIALPQFLSFSNYIYYSSPILFISSARGGIGAFDFSDKKEEPSFSNQKTAVLTNFTLSKNGFIGRIEGGPVVSIFTKSPFKLYMKKNFANLFISKIFELDNGSLAICTRASIKIININDSTAQPIEIALPPLGSQIEPVEKTDFITDVANLSSNTKLLLSALGKIFIMQDTRITCIFKKSKISRIFPLTEELALFTYKGYEHVVYNINTKMDISKIHSCVGQNGLFLGAQTHYIAPHTFSHSNDLLLIGKQGLNVQTFSPFDFGEPIYGLHSFSAQNQNFIVVSFQNSSKLLEVVDTCIKVSEKVFIKENIRTLGICPLTTSQGMNLLFQVTPDGLFLYHSKLQSCDVVLDTAKKYSSHIICYTSNSRQILVYDSNKTFFMIQLNLITNGNDNISFNVNFVVTAMTFSEPDKSTGLSEYVIYGVYDNAQASIEVHQFSIDNAARVRLISEKMPSKVVSVKVTNCNVDGVEVMKVIAGLEDGTVVVGNIDIAQRVIDKISIIQFGSYECHLTQIFPRYEYPVFLALNSRPLLITIIKGLPHFCPLAHTSIGYAVAVADKPLFLLASGTTIQVASLCDIDSLSSANETTMTMTSFKFGSKIFSVIPIPNDRFVFVALTNSIFLFDSLKTILFHKDPLAIYHDEEIRATCSGLYSTHFQLCVGTVKLNSEGEKISVIRLYYNILTQQGVQTRPPIIGECKMQVTAICINQQAVFAACGDTLFCFKQFEDSLQVVSRMSNVGVCIKSLIYLPPISRGSPQMMRGQKGEIYAGDVSKSVKLFRFSEKSKQFKLKAEEGTPRNITALAKYDDRFVCGGDILGNVFILEYPQIPLNSNSVLDKGSFKACRRLSLKFNFFVGESITGVQFTSNIFNCLWYSTVSGGLGGFISFCDQNGSNPTIKNWIAEFSRQIHLLKKVEMEVAHYFIRFTGCDQISFRNKFFVSTNVIDLDIIEIYLMLSEEAKLEIINNIQETSKFSSVKFDNLKPTDIEFEINKVRKYFIEWHSKR